MLQLGVKMRFILIAMIVFGCSQQESVEVPRFSGVKAFQYLEKQCEFGPRNPGSTGHKEFANYLENFLKERFDNILIQEFEYIEPVTESLRKGKNFIVQFNQDAKYRLLIGAHWDTRAISDQDKNIEHKTLPVLGANDGGSGTAILMTLYDMFTADEPPIGIDLVFFDAEDVGRSFEGNTFAVGSEFFSKNLPIKKPDFAIIVDMVGDKQLNLPIERFSYNIAPKKVKEIWDMAEEIGRASCRERV